MPARVASLRFGPPPCHRLVWYSSTLPADIVAATVPGSSPRRGLRSKRCDPGTTRVAPFASVKSVSAQMALQPSGRWGLGSGMEPSSACSGWAS